MISAWLWALVIADAPVTTTPTPPTPGVPGVPSSLPLGSTPLWVAILLMTGTILTPIMAVVTFVLFFRLRRRQEVAAAAKGESEVKLTDEQTAKLANEAAQINETREREREEWWQRQIDSLRDDLAEERRIANEDRQLTLEQRRQITQLLRWANQLQQWAREAFSKAREVDPDFPEWPELELNGRSSNRTNTTGPPDNYL